jgi:hypothetical protein
MTPYQWLLFGLTDEFRSWCEVLAETYNGLLFVVRRGDGLLQPLIMPR